MAPPAWQDFLTAILSERVLIFDLFGRLVFGHPQAIEASGLTVGREVGLVYPEAWPLFQEVMLSGRARFGLRLESDATEIVLDVFAMNHPDQPKGVVCLLRKDDEHEGGGEGLGRLSRSLRTILDSSYDGLWICDSKANVIQINRASERLNQISAEEVIGRNMRDLVAEGLFDRSITLEVLEKRAPVTRVQTTRGGKRLLSTGNPVFGRDGEIVMVVTNDRDLSELDRLREEILSKTAVSRRYQEELINRQVEGLIQEDIIFRSAAMERVIETAIRVARVDSSVLITGPSGVGKELIADLIHRRSPRADGPIVKLNCGAVPETLFESELFGYEPGAFTGAQKQGKPGLVEAADKGTLFLDEVGETPLSAQVKLLRFLDDGLVQRVGSTKPRPVSVRLIAATNRDLAAMVARGDFREDLYYRLRVVPIAIPPLKERPEDIPALVEHFIRRFSAAFGLEKRLTAPAMDLLTTYDFPGNVRELVNICERLVVMSPGESIEPRDLPSAVRRGEPIEAGTAPTPVSGEVSGGGLKERLAAFERRLLEEALAKHRTQQAAAKALGVDQSTVARKLKKYNLKAEKPA